MHAEAALPSNCVTKTQARDYTKRIAYALHHTYSIGARGPGRDVIVCISSGQVLLSSVFYGVIAAGGVFSAASSSFTYLELARQVSQGKSTLIVASPDCQDVAVKAAKECGVPLERVLVLESMGGQRRLQDVLGKSKNFLEGVGKEEEMLEWERITDKRILEERVICLLYSSGTTGVPKGLRDPRSLNLYCGPEAEADPYLQRRKPVAHKPRLRRPDPPVHDPRILRAPEAPRPKLQL